MRIILVVAVVIAAAAALLIVSAPADLTRGTSAIVEERLRQETPEQIKSRRDLEERMAKELARRDQEEARRNREEPRGRNREVNNTTILASLAPLPAEIKLGQVDMSYGL